MKKFFILAVATVLVSGISAAETFAQVMKEGHAQRAKRQYAKAVEAFKKARTLAVSQNDKFTSAFFTGVTQGELKQFDQSLVTLREALAIAKFPSQKSSAQFHIGYHLGCQQKYDEAIAEMEKVEAVSPTPTGDYVLRSKTSLGQYMLAQKKYDKITETVKPAMLSRNHDIAIYAYSLSFEASKKLKNNDGIKAAAEAVKKLNPKGMSSIFTQKRICYEYSRMNKDFETAVKFALEIPAIKGMPAIYRDHGHFYAGSTYEAMKQPQKALEEWKKVEKSVVPSIRKTANERIAKLTKKK